MSAYCAFPRTPLRKSDHTSILVPVYKPPPKTVKLKSNTTKIWPTDATKPQKGCFECTLWNIFRSYPCNSLDKYTNTVRSYIWLCVDQCTLTIAIMLHGNSKPRFSKEFGTVHRKKNSAFTSGEIQVCQTWTGLCNQESQAWLQKKNKWNNNNVLPINPVWRKWQTAKWASFTTRWGHKPPRQPHWLLCKVQVCTHPSTPPSFSHPGSLYEKAFPQKQNKKKAEGPHQISPAGPRGSLIFSTSPYNSVQFHRVSKNYLSQPKQHASMTSG